MDLLLGKVDIDLKSSAESTICDLGRVSLNGWDRLARGDRDTYQLILAQNLLSKIFLVIVHLEAHNSGSS